MKLSNTMLTRLNILDDLRDNYWNHDHSRDEDGGQDGDDDV